MNSAIQIHTNVYTAQDDDAIAKVSMDIFPIPTILADELAQQISLTVAKFLGDKGLTDGSLSIPMPTEERPQ